MVKRKKPYMDDPTEEIIEEDADLMIESSPDIPEEIPTEEVDQDLIVDQVLKGEWGVGQDRRLRLAQAGHDPNAVQREIVRRANQK